MNFLCGFGELNHHDSIIPPSGLKSGGRTAGRSFLEVFRHNAVCCEIAEPLYCNRERLSSFLLRLPRLSDNQCSIGGRQSGREIVHESFKLCLCLPIPLFGRATSEASFSLISSFEDIGYQSPGGL